MASGRTLLRTVPGTLWLAFALLGSCKGKEKLPHLGTSISGPVDVATSPSGNLFYALNSDYQRRYDKGSILVIDPNAADGNYKRAAIETRRLGRTLNVSQNLMLISFDDPTRLNFGYLELWSLADEANPIRIQSWNLDCSPINAVIAPTRPYFAATCINGEVYVGSWVDGDPTKATFDLVRSYGYEHRALYFYEGSNKTWLLGFPSDSGLPDYSDQVLDDKISYVVADKTTIEQPNVVPDAFEDSESARRKPGQGAPYQMFAYNVTDEEKSSADLKAAGDASFDHLRRIDSANPYSNPSQANFEMNYVHFILREANGEPNTTVGTADLYKRYYRTNFYEAKRGPEGRADVFYLSQRDNSPSLKPTVSNSVLKLTVDESALARLLGERIPFDEVFSVERIYGFEADRDSSGRFPSDFEFASLDGEDMLLVNHFRDLINFRDATFYGVTRKLLGDAYSLDRPSSADTTNYANSYFQLAISTSGKVLTGSFYGDALFLFDARPRISMKDQTPIRIE